MKKINFNEPYVADKSLFYLQDVLEAKQFEKAKYTTFASDLLKKITQSKAVFLTNSCTAALEMAALLLDLKAGDEIIMPSFTFVTTATAFVLRGAVPVFVDINPHTLTIDPSLISAAITSKTKAIVAVHYAGVACEMDEIMQIAKQHNLLVIEDAAQGIDATYKNKPLGSIGHLAAMSFHPTKNITAGLGGALLVNDEQFIERAKIIWQKGTNREAFIEGKIDKYTWVDIGSSYMPSELTAAMLYAQLESLSQVTELRNKTWDHYYEALKVCAQQNEIQLPHIPDHCKHNAHIFYLLMKTQAHRTSLINYLAHHGIDASFHYIPLHLSEAGKKWTRFNSEKLKITEDIYKRLVRLPLHCFLNDEFSTIVELVTLFLTKVEV